jgi:uridine kinase
MKRAVFDLDGTLIADAGGIFIGEDPVPGSEEIGRDYKMYPGTYSALQNLKDAGYELAAYSWMDDSSVRMMLKRTAAAALFSRVFPSVSEAGKPDLFRSLMGPEDYTVFVVMNGADQALAHGLGAEAVEVSYALPEDPEKDNVDTEGRAGELALFSAGTAEEMLDRICEAEVFSVLSREFIGKRHCRMIGIGGLDAAGEPRFTERFSEYLRRSGQKTMIVHMSDYRNPPEVLAEIPDPIEAHLFNYYNYWKLIRLVLEPLKTEKSLHVTVACLDPEADSYDIHRQYDADENTVVLIEGSTLFRQPLLEYLDAKVFLEIDFLESIKRGLDREDYKYDTEILQKYKELYIPVQKRYKHDCRPEDICDVRIDYGNINRPVIAEIRETTS